MISFKIQVRLSTKAFTFKSVNFHAELSHLFLILLDDHLILFFLRFNFFNFSMIKFHFPRTAIFAANTSVG